MSYNVRDELNDLIEQIAVYAPRYLTELGVAKGNPEHLVSCLNPDHADRNPSMGYYKEGKIYHCFSCNANYSIFKIAHQYEGKPLYGKEFITHNVFYLADRFGIDRSMYTIDFTPEDLERFKQYDVFKILSEHVLKNQNLEFLKARSIKVETAMTLKVGSVVWETLKKELNTIADDEFLKALGITERNLNQNKLVLIIKDNQGRPVSFVSREMVYQPTPELKEKIKSLVVGKTFETKKAEQDFLLPHLTLEETKALNTPKYCNGKTSLIYNKSEIFYGYSDVKKRINRFKPVLIIEGYLDFITAYQAGIYNVLALGSASITDEHLKFLENSYYINKVAFAFDQDETGKKRTKTLIDRLTSNTQESNLLKRYEVAFYKGLYKDLDEAIVIHGKTELEEIFDLKTIFQYMIEFLISSDADPEYITELGCTAILQEQNHLKRSQMALELAEKIPTFSSDTILRRVNFKEDFVKHSLQKKFEHEIKNFKEALLIEPENHQVLLKRLAEGLNGHSDGLLKKKNSIFDRTLENLEHLMETITDYKKETISTGYQIFDQARITAPNVITICGRANSFKTTVFENTALSILKNSPNTMVFYYSTDDTSNKIIVDFISCLTSLPREYCANPLGHPEFGLEKSNAPEAFVLYQTWLNGFNKIKSYIKDKRLIIQQSSNLTTWNSFEDELSMLAQDSTLKNVSKVAIIDSVNKIETPGIAEDNARIAFLSERTKKAAETYNFTIFQNVELKKIPNRYLVSMADLRGSARLEYDPNFIVSGNNNLHNLQNDTELCFRLKEYPTQLQPIICLMVEKTKIGGDKNVPYFYEIHGPINLLVEVGPGHKNYENYKDRWEADLSKYTNNTTNKF